MGAYLTDEELEILYGPEDDRPKSRDRDAYIYMRSRMRDPRPSGWERCEVRIGWKAVSLATRDTIIKASTEKPYVPTREAVRGIWRRLEQFGLIEKQPQEDTAGESIFRFTALERSEFVQKKSNHRTTTEEQPRDGRVTDCDSSGSGEKSNHRTTTEEQPQSRSSKEKKKTSSSTASMAPATGNRFEAFWEAYGKKIGRKACMAKWKARHLDEKADMIIADVVRRRREHRPWLDGYQPHPLTYLNGDRWEDEVEVAVGSQSAGMGPPQLCQHDGCAKKAAAELGGRRYCMTHYREAVNAR